jgi:acetyl-CoA carboxylase biotin carboxyl carrier protein
MAESAPERREPESPDVQTIRQLVRLMQRYDLTAIDLGEGPHKIRLRRRGSETPSAAGSSVSAAPAAIPLAGPAVAPSAHNPSPAEAKGVFIESPMVGTFYAAGTPDAPPFVSVGSTVEKNTTVCIIEAMKVFTDIPAGMAGTITEVLVKNGQPVEFGQALFRIDPT